MELDQRVLDKFSLNVEEDLVRLVVIGSVVGAGIPVLGRNGLGNGVHGSRNQGLVPGGQHAAGIYGRALRSLVGMEKRGVDVTPAIARPVLIGMAVLVLGGELSGSQKGLCKNLYYIKTCSLCSDSQGRVYLAQLASSATSWACRTSR